MLSYHRVVAAILRQGEQVLLCHRRPDRQWFGDVWDLPGGHVEDDEDDGAALVRELSEELGVTIPLPTGHPVFAGEVGPDTHITVWTVDTWDGVVTNVATDEHDRIGWFRSSELVGLTVADPAITELCLGVLNRPDDQTR
jgi:8-oxo-dGTP pyrophosphatase MutT (NUDIX family)